MECYFHLAILIPGFPCIIDWKVKIARRKALELLQRAAESNSSCISVCYCIMLVS